MTRHVDPSNRFWWETNGNKTSVGFTPMMLEKMQECFHIVPGKQRGPVREKGPLMSVECLEGLFSIPSPVSGMITFFEPKAMNFPDQLTEEDTVCIITDTKEVAKPKETATMWVDEFAPLPNWDAQPARGRVRPQPAQAFEGPPQAPVPRLRTEQDVNRRLMDLLTQGLRFDEALARANAERREQQGDEQ